MSRNLGDRIYGRFEELDLDSVQEIRALRSPIASKEDSA